MTNALNANMDEMQGVLNSTVSKLIERNDTLEAMMTTLKKKIEVAQGGAHSL